MVIRPFRGRHFLTTSSCIREKIISCRIKREENTKKFPTSGTWYGSERSQGAEALEWCRSVLYKENSALYFPREIRERPFFRHYVILRTSKSRPYACIFETTTYLTYIYNKEFISQNNANSNRNKTRRFW